MTTNVDRQRRRPGANGVPTNQRSVMTPEQIARLLNEARNTRGYSEGDLRSLIRSLADVVEELAPKPVDRNVTVRCVYGKCAGASFTSEDAAERDMWMDGHVRVAPHSDRWPVTFALEYPSGNRSVAYRDAVTVDA